MPEKIAKKLKVIASEKGEFDDLWWEEDFYCIVYHLYGLEFKY